MEKGGRLSYRREMVMEVLSKKNFHPTAEEIYHIIKAEMPNIGLATVYRQIEKLVTEKKIKRLEQGNRKPCRYEGNPAPHYHVKCRYCGAVADVWRDINPLAGVDKDVFGGFSDIGYNLDFEGCCPDCLEIKSYKLS